MASTDPEIKSGFSLPVWMKSKPTATKDYELFAASPPAPEDSFFFIKYPQSDVVFGKQTAEPEFTKVIQETSDVIKSANYNPKEKDWSKHTKPCQDVLHGAAVASMNSTKPKGTDDGFKGEGAACGNSIVKVASQMISNRPPARGFTVASPSDDPIEIEAREKYHMSRRGSKSLPVTPSHSPPSSPTSRRKNGNRFFTSPFGPAATDSSNRSWLTTALLGLQRDMSSSTSTLIEEEAIEARLQGATLAESVENLGPSPRGKIPDSEPSLKQPITTKAASTFRPKPSELREMNFWSPTSM